MRATALLAPVLDNEPTAASPAVSQIATRAPRAIDSATLELIEDRAQFDALEADWTDLFARAGQSHQLFLSFNWLWHWCNHYLPAAGAKGPKLAIVTARRDGRLVMAWPMVSERVHGLTTLSWMGEPVSQYGDVLVDGEEDVASLLASGWSFIRTRLNADLLRLRKVRADAVVAQFLSTAAAGIVTETLQAPYLDLASAPNFAAYEQRYSSKAKRNRKRLRRLLDEQGDVSFEEVTGGAEARALIAKTVELKRQWLVSRGLVSKALAEERFEKFFADVAGAEQRPADCRVAVLKHKGQVLAMTVGLKHRERIVQHIIVFDIAHQKSGVGVLILEQSLRNAFAAGAGCYDLMAPGDAYKMDWADATVEVRDWALPLSLAGRLYARHYLGTIRTGLKRAVAAMPQDFRKQINGMMSRVLMLA